MKPEFSRVERIDTIGEQDRAVSIEADEAERAALAGRFGLIAVDTLSGDFTVRREAAGYLVRGTVKASVVQACSVTEAPLPVTITEQVALRYIADDGASGDAEEIDLGADAIDTVALEGGGIDLGEAAAETMALALDPFPRSPEAEAALREAGVKTEEEARAESSPFGALAGLRDRLKS